jgi:cation transport ATPase
VKVGDGSQPLRQALIRVLLAITSAALRAGGTAWLLGARDVAGIFWAAGTLVAIAPAVWSVVAALNRGRVGADIIAVLALVGTLAIHEYLAGALIGVMLATGQAVEVAAERRAAKDLRSLLDRAPRVARRRTAGGLRTVPVDEVAVGDVLVVGPGEVLPVDAMVTSDWAILDESALTGESVQQRLPNGSSGAQWGGQCRWGRGDSRHSDGG